MQGEKNLQALLKTMKPVLNPGAYVFCVIEDIQQVAVNSLLSFFKEKEGYTITIAQEEADRLQLSYTFVAAWITLTVYSSLEAVGLTAAFSKALSEGGVSCNVVAAFYHDHIFVPIEDAQKAMCLLHALSKQS